MELCVILELVGLGLGLGGLVVHHVVVRSRCVVQQSAGLVMEEGDN